jgi:flagellar export protein FliJ
MTRHDAGLRAVERVRAVRERDSRLGLQQALAELADRETAELCLRDRIGRGSAVAVATTGDFVAQRTALLAMGTQLVDLGRETGAARLLRAVAEERWQQDRARLRAVEMLLERRASERRTEAARREARELDDLAAQRWLRGAGQ